MVMLTPLRLLPKTRVTQQVMTDWLPRVQSSLAPPSDRNAILRRLHQKQEVEAAPDAEDGDPRHSILCAGMARDASQPRPLHLVAYVLAVLSLHPRLGHGLHCWRVAELVLYILGVAFAIHVFSERHQSAMPLPADKGQPDSVPHPHPGLPRVPLPRGWLP